MVAFASNAVRHAVRRGAYGGGGADQAPQQACRARETGNGKQHRPARSGDRLAASEVAEELPHTLPKPEGGFSLLPVRSVIKVFQELGPGATRDFLALVEMRERRCVLERDRSARFRLEELRALTAKGRTLRQVRRSVDALVELGVVEPKGSSIRFPKVDVDEETESRLAGIPSLIPIPRRMTRYLCSCSKRSLLGTALGHLIRCMRYRKSEKLCSARGRVAAWWVEEVFRISESSVRRARRALIAERLLEGVDGRGPVCGRAKTLENTHGKNVLVNLRWQRRELDSKEAAARESTTVGERTLTGPLSKTAPSLTGPKETKNSSSKNLQKPELQPDGPEPSGFCKKETNKTRSGRAKPPVLRDVKLPDLHSVPRILELGREAERKGWIEDSRSVSKQLELVALAHRALSFASNPCAFFRRMLERANFSTIGQADEDAAREDLNRFLYGTPTRKEKRAAERERAQTLSPDAEFIQRLRWDLGRKGIRLEVALPDLYRAKPEWNVDRVRGALEELRDTRTVGLQDLELRGCREARPCREARVRKEPRRKDSSACPMTVRGLDR